VLKIITLPEQFPLFSSGTVILLLSFTTLHALNAPHLETPTKEDVVFIAL
jgi:hypothetical protein